ncbi:ABC transporter substrate-binding protein [Geminicoccaceae bacterium 1502E]|nr:ABC transporter substrate-binding protein [Geminicoccaceae bacterium 1502E]
MPFLSRRRLCRLAVLAPLVLAAGPLEAGAFEAVREKARGQTVYLNAWGGSPQINDYVAWAGRQTSERFGVELVHVKLTDTGEAVSRVLAEKAAGRLDGGSVDLVWINGENFAAMKEQELLFGPFAGRLPNAALVDTEGKPTTLVDFTLPTDGYESPWGMAQFVFFHDTARLAEPPRSIAGLLAWAEENPGRFAYPAPPDFTGTSFLKHVLRATVADPARLRSPVTPEAFDAMSGGLWDYLDALRPHLWRSGTTYPANKEALHQLLDDGAVDLSMAYNPAEGSSLIEAGRLPDTVRSFILEGGTIGNTHFLAIPFNAAHKEGAMVVADFLLSPEAQARKQDPAVWGDPTVLAVDRLAPADRARFEALELGVATLPPEALVPSLPEPDPSWVRLLEARWIERYAR